jgi:uncharacterized protein (DUF2267 family)
MALPILRKNIQKTSMWLYDIGDSCDWEEPDQQRALAILRATLQELRDLLPLGNMAHLSAQLPLFIRGLFFEGWNPQRNPSKGRKKDAFLESIEDHLQPYLVE